MKHVCFKPFLTGNVAVLGLSYTFHLTYFINLTRFMRIFKISKNINYTSLQIESYTLLKCINS
jgi:hypothetical protein